ncbi:hypothetical protein D0U00_11705 [Leclercia adecarboxylata]|uniref:hypothetical protein n=1 Tax=Leclercia adecarboxylata TaxID=83655 RepID=UPI000E3B933D|nr:hypothetical protein [Leclercia adecarboxylata]RFS78981.1 hypothetical protein D0U00_11705 [Leclercia adecarboxylata]
MSDSLSNKELVAVGHQFAKAMSSDTAIMDIAKIVSRLAERLDCTTLALREMTKQRDALAAENAGLKQNTPGLQTMMSALDEFFADEEVPERAMLGAYNILRGAVLTPATDAYLAEVRAQGMELFAREMHADISEADAIEFAAQLRQEPAQ